MTIFLMFSLELSTPFQLIYKRTHALPELRISNQTPLLLKIFPGYLLSPHPLPIPCSLTIDLPDFSELYRAWARRGSISSDII